MFDKGFKQHCGTEIIRAGIVHNVVHALSDTHSRRQVVDHIDLVERTLHQRRISDVSNDELDLGIEIIWPPPFSAMDLRGKYIEGADIVTRCQ
jgi:hypothetical protein